jgi:hypothetical protein
MRRKAFQNSWNIWPPEVLAKVLIECGDLGRGLTLLDHAQVTRADGCGRLALWAIFSYSEKAK